MSLIDGLRDLVASAKDAAGQLHTAVQKIRAKLDAVRAEMHRLQTAPPSRPELTRNVSDLIGQAGGTFKLRFGEMLRTAVSGRLRPDGSLRPPQWPDDPALAMVGLSRPMLEALCALLPHEALVAGFVEAMDAAPAAAAGPPMAERPALLARAKEEEGRLLHEDHEAVVAAAEAGLTIGELPENAALRMREERKREAHERDLIANRTYYRHHPDERPVEEPTS